MMAFLPIRVSGTVSELTRELDAWQQRLDLKGPLPRTWKGRLRRDLEAEATADLRAAVAAQLLAARGRRRGRRYLGGEELAPAVAAELGVRTEGSLEEQRELIVTELSRRIIDARQAGVE